EARQVECVCMPCVNETSGDRARSGVEILVAAPDGEVGVPVVQAQRRGAGGVREIETDDAAVAPRGACNLFHVEQLSGEELHAWQQRHGKLAGFAFYELADVLQVGRAPCRERAQ